MGVVRISLYLLGSIYPSGFARIIVVPGQDNFPANPIHANGDRMRRFGGDRHGQGLDSMRNVASSETCTPVPRRAVSA